jgi:hypothetical protein
MEPTVLALGAAPAVQWQSYLQSRSFAAEAAGRDHAVHLGEWLGPDDTLAMVVEETTACVVVEGTPANATADRRLALRLATSASGAAAIVIRVDGRGGVWLTVASSGSTDCRAWAGNMLRLDAHGCDILRVFDDGAEWSIVALRLAERIERLEIGNRFFRDIHALVRQLDGAWMGGLTSDEARQMSIQTLCRFLFIYFLRSRGWLGNDGLPAALLLHPRESDLYRATIEPLFFEALNVPHELRCDTRFAAIPFLNGGLFARTALERERMPTMPDDAVRAIVLTLERYHFVATRQEGATVGLDPILLSEIFERLMDVEEREKTGAFYTPPALVADVVDAAITDALVAGGHGDALGCVQGQRPCDRESLVRLRSRLLSLRIVDPAAGSGAFLLGCYTRLAGLLDEIDSALGENDAHEGYVARRAIVTSVLYGVDRSATAALIAVLRLWLALAAAVPPGAQIEPLPNLQTHVRTGDSLLDSVDPGGPPVVLSAAQRLELHGLVTAVTGAHGRAKEELESRLHETLRRTMTSVILERLLATRTEAEALQNQSREAGTLTSPRGLTVGETHHLTFLLRRIHVLNARLGAIDDERQPLPFDWRLHFALEHADGFDVVIGNPPWVRIAALERGYRAALVARYRWMSAERGKSGYAAAPDLSVAFVEKSVQLCRPGGTIALLLPSKHFRAGYAGRMRSDILSSHSLVACRDYSTENVRFFDATAYPALLVLRSGSEHRPAGVVVTAGGTTSVIARELVAYDDNPGSPWPLWDAATARATRRLLAGSQRVRDVYEPRLGVKTGCNEAFVNPPLDVAPCVSCLTGAAVASGDTVRLLFAHDTQTGAPLGDVNSATHTWLANHAQRLEARADADDQTPPWGLFRVGRAALGWRVAWRDIATRLEAFVLPPVALGGPVILNTLYCIACQDEAEALRLATWLNHPAIQVLATQIADPASGGYRRFLGGTVGALPLPYGFSAAPAGHYSLLDFRPDPRLAERAE